MRVIWIGAVLGIAVVASACNDNGRAAAERDIRSNPSYQSDFEKSDETYAEYDERRDELEESTGDFDGYGCTQDCSGHEAGYRWAAEEGITDPDECGGMSWSFEEGCRDYAREQTDDDTEAED